MKGIAKTYNWQCSRCGRIFQEGCKRCLEADVEYHEETCGKLRVWGNHAGDEQARLHIHRGD